MPRRPMPRFDKTSRLWRVRLNGKSHYLGGANARYVDVLERFHRLYRETFHAAPPSAPSPLTPSELIEAWVRDIGAGTTNDHWQYRNVKGWPDFCHSIAVVMLDEIEADHLRRYADYLRKSDAKPATIKHYVDAASRALTWAASKGFIDSAPGKPSIRKSHYQAKDLTVSRVAKLDRTLDTEKRLQHVAPLARFMLLTGARPGEACRLRWDQVRADQNIVLLSATEHKTGKATGKGRTVYLTIEAVELLGTVARSGSAFVFLNSRGRPYTVAGVRTMLRDYGITPNQLRHTFAQNQVDQGAKLDTVGKAMGHTSDVTTRKYAEVRDASVLSDLESRASVLRRARDVRLRSVGTLKQRAAALKKQKPRKPEGTPQPTSRKSSMG